jgi:hypothetical protein
MIDSVKTQNFWTVLSKFGSNEIVTLSIVIVLLLILFIIVTKPTVKVGSVYISFGLFKRRVVDFSHVIEKTTEIVTKICYLENITVVERQMDYVEQKIVAVKSLLMQNYALLLFEKTKIANITAHEDYITYSRLIESMLREDIKGFIKRSLINEDFLELSETELKYFAKENFEYLYQIGSQFLDTWYISNKMQISREELRVSTVNLKDKLYEILYNVFSRSISQLEELMREKKMMQEELDIFYEKVIGSKRKD